MLWGSDSTAAEDARVMGCDAKSLDKWFLSFESTTSGNTLSVTWHYFPKDLSSSVIKFELIQSPGILGCDTG
jgi:hypothetical protein